MILSDRDIEERLDDGDLIIDPIVDRDLQIQPASVDLRLGREFLEFNRTNIACIHPDREEEVDEYVTKTTVSPGAGQAQATLEGDEVDEHRTRSEFILHPSDFVLGTTMERVEIPNDLIAHVEGRSSLGRLAIVVHASLPSDEEVFLWTPEDGFGFYPIGEIVENTRPARAVSFDPRTMRVRTHQVTDYIENPTKRIYQISLASGREVRVTKDHNLFSIDSTGRVIRLPSEEAMGQFVMIPKHLPDPQVPKTSLDLLDVFDDTHDMTAVATDGLGVLGQETAATNQHHQSLHTVGSHTEISRTNLPETIDISFDSSSERLPRTIPVTPEFAWVLGFSLRHGTVQNDEVFLTHSNPELLDRATNWFEQFTTNIEINDASSPMSVTIHSRCCSKLFTGLLTSGQEKILPDEVWNWSNNVLEALFHGLVSGLDQEHPTLESSTLELANQLMYLASRLGYRNTMRPRKTTRHQGDATEWTVNITTDAHPHDPILPIPGELLRTYRETADWSMREAAEAIGYASPSSIAAVENERYDGIKQSTLRRFRDAYADTGIDTTRLNQLTDGDVCFDRVMRVEKTDRVEPTYDLEVQPGGRPIENFIGGHGGIFLSNTAGIVDPGYRGQITLELSNLGSAPVSLTPGMRISQLTFTELTSPARRPYGSERGSKYQDQKGPQASRVQHDHEFSGDQK